MTPLRVLSLGAGVQSTSVLLLALEGTITLDAAVFADTGWEPAAVYAHLARLEELAAGVVPILRVSGGDIRKATPFGTGGALDAPFYLTSATGAEAMARRQCTSKLKVAPVRRAIRKLMEQHGKRRCVLTFGISLDESQRMRKPDVAYLDHDYPLVDKRWRRSDCVAFLAERGITAPRSACIGCPYRTDAEWRALDPDEFADAVEWERTVQAVGMPRGMVPFVHRSRVPLADVDLSTAEDRGQLTFTDECEGMCGV